MFELDPDIIKANILGIFEKDWVKTMAARVLTRKLLTDDARRTTDDARRTTDIQVSQKLTLSKLR